MNTWSWLFSSLSMSFVNSPKVVEVTDFGDDLEQDLLSQIEEYRKFKLLCVSTWTKHQERAQYYSKAPTELIYEDAELVHETRPIDLFFWLFQIP